MKQWIFLSFIVSAPWALLTAIFFSLLWFLV